MAPHLVLQGHSHTVPGGFVQDEYTPAEWLTLALSGRVDHHSEYGTFLNPKLSALLRPTDDWTVRASAGSGFLAPTPWTEETEAVGLARLAPMRLEAERARNASLDVSRTIGPIELNATLSASRINKPIQARPAAGHITVTHVYMRSTEPDPVGAGRREVPLTPRQTAALVAAWEQEQRHLPPEPRL